MNLQTSPERRVNARLASEYQVKSEWCEAPATVRRARGVTRDLSRDGTFCFLERAIAPGTPVRLEIVFPEEIPGESSLRLFCAGHVLRQETHGRRLGAAIAIESTEVVFIPNCSSGPERRVYPRLDGPVGTKIHYEAGTGYIRDLSLSGVYLDTDHPLPLGKTLSVSVQGIPGCPQLELEAIVRRSDFPVGMALEFIGTNKQADEAMHEGLAQLRLQRNEEGLDRSALPDAARCPDGTGPAAGSVRSRPLN